MPDLDHAKTEFDELQLLKLQQTQDVITGCFDLLNDDIAGPEWLGKIATLAGCNIATCIWWQAGSPDTYLKESSGPQADFPLEMLKHLDSAVASQQPNAAFVVHDLCNHTSSLTLGQKRSFFPSGLLVACIDWAPANVFILLGDRHSTVTGRESGADWTERDCLYFQSLLPIFRKSFLVKKQLSRYADMLDLINKLFDVLPRGYITLMPNRKMLRSNCIADAMIREEQLIVLNNSYVEFCDPGTQQELIEQIEKVDALPKDELTDYVWYKNLSGSTGQDSVLLTLRVFGLDAWRLESTPDDRILVMILEQEGLRSAPSQAQLREFYQLTPAQARLLHAILGNVSVEKAAQSLNISVNTARTHLRAIYSRIGVKSKGQLLKTISATLTGAPK